MLRLQLESPSNGCHSRSAASLLSIVSSGHRWRFFLRPISTLNASGRLKIEMEFERSMGLVGQKVSANLTMKTESFRLIREVNHKTNQKNEWPMA